MLALQVTCSTYDLLPTDLQDGLYGVGRVQLRCLSGQQRDVAVYTTAPFGHIQLLQPRAQPVPRMLGAPGAGGQEAHAWQAGRVGGQVEGEAQDQGEAQDEGEAQEEHVDGDGRRPKKVSRVLQRSLAFFLIPPFC